VAPNAPFGEGWDGFPGLRLIEAGASNYVAPNVPFGEDWDGFPELRLFEAGASSYMYIHII